MLILLNYDQLDVYITQITTTYKLLKKNVQKCGQEELVTFMHVHVALVISDHDLHCVVMTIIKCVWSFFNNRADERADG